MKKFGYFLIASLLLVSGLFAQKSIVVTNTSGLNRKGEIVEVKYKSANSFVLKNNEGKETGYQLTYNSKKEVCGFLFQADVKAKSSATYLIKAGTPISGMTSDGYGHPIVGNPDLGPFETG